MEIISIPQLRLGQLQTLTEQTLELTKPVEQIATYVAAVEAAFEPFRSGMLKEFTVSDKRALDNIRDKYLSSLFMGIKIEKNYPQEDTVLQEIVGKLRQVARKYSADINRLPYDEETAAIDNLLAELETVDMQGMPHLVRWVDKIKVANENFKAASKEYLESTVKYSATQSASAAAPALVAALEELYTMFFAYTKVAADETLVTVYRELAELVDAYR
ncbi:DUF6261 family protein [Abyssalbus ytuae]|uniref:DUF6261 family protein n=1 Tax=Abyssalbus ytuae TaxID=2926907 RepID=A0A9E7D360_9FLAO|nr:DUF6261 family protein [Abyssalbus ytuae]UOB18938.1 DUF6261 family protein [Abyssalbus ytuae]